MTIGRISTYATHQNTLTNFNRVQLNLTELQRQISSGRKSDTFAGLNGVVEQFTSVNAKMTRAEQYYQQNAIVIGRLQTMDSAMDSLTSIAQEARNLIVLSRNPAVGDTMNLKIQAQRLLENIEGQLNTNIEGRYLFAGGKTDRPAVSDLTVSNLIGLTPNDSYYQGDGLDLAVNATDSMTVTYGVRANEEGIMKLVGALHAAILGEDAENPEVYLEQAHSMVNEAIDGIVTLGARINSNITLLQRTNEQHESQRLYWKGLTEELTKTDIVEASTQVSVEQAILQAAFQTFSRITSLNLSDYLR
jgi:flagellar hook-associated protein 3 FlgL